MHSNLPKLKQLHALARLGISVLIITILGGYMVAGLHLRTHYENRDERPGMTIDDIVGAYHGISTPSILVESLEDDHPDNLADESRKILLDWLAGNAASVSINFDNLDLGDNAPAEIIAASCLDCHSRGASGEDTYPELPLEYWDDIQPLAFSKNIQPTGLDIVAASQHAHAPSMAMVLLIIGGLALMTRWSQCFIGLVLAVASIGLFADMAGQWLTRDYAAMAWMIVGGGFVYAGGVTVLALAALLDCWLPGPKVRGDE